MTERQPDIEADITFLATSEGGRHAPANSNYRGTHDFGVAGMLNDAAHVYIGCESAAPGTTTSAYIYFLAPEYQTGRLYPGFKFTVQEGARVVGSGVVIEVLNDALRKPV